MRALYIVGDSRSGSTLLQHLLSLQEGVVALGEVRRLEPMVRAGESCACGEVLDRCPFWTGIASRIGRPLLEVPTVSGLGPWRRRLDQGADWTALAMGLELARRIVSREQRLAVESSLGIYRAAAEMTGGRVVVDSSKVPSQFLHLRARAPGLVRPVFLVRDGRAISHSKLQRRKDHTAARVARQFLNVSGSMLALRRVVPGSTLVRYEDLCRNPAAVLEEILRPLDVPVRTTDLSRLPPVRHDLGGSPRFKGSGSGAIKLDERWRTEMPKEDLATFEKIAGRMNRRLGYG